MTKVLLPDGKGRQEVAPLFFEVIFGCFGYSKTDSNQINMDLFVAQPPINHSLTLKPLDYKDNGSHTTVINLLSKDF